MPPSTIDAKIRAHIESFTHELAELVKQAAVESVQDALSGGTSTRRTKKAKGRPRSTKATKRAPSRSGRRSPEQNDDREAFAVFRHQSTDSIGQLGHSGHSDGLRMPRPQSSETRTAAKSIAEV